MRRHTDLVEQVDAHSRNKEARHRLRTVHGKQGTLLRPAAVHPEYKNFISAWLDRHFEFPSGEFAIVTDNGQKLSLPYPLLGALLALFVWIAGGTLAGVWALATMSTNVSNLTDTITREQAKSDSERKALQEKIELQALLISDLREKVIRLEAKRGN